MTTAPFTMTREMIETIAAGLDHAAAHTSAKRLREQAEQRGEVVRVGEEVKPFRRGIDHETRRCSECSGELSYCGEMGIDGPTIDCKDCLLRDQIEDERKTSEKTIAALQSQLAAEREAVRVLGRIVYWMGTRDSLSQVRHTYSVSTPDPIASAAIEAARKAHAGEVKNGN